MMRLVTCEFNTALCFSLVLTETATRERPVVDVPTLALEISMLADAGAGGEGAVLSKSELGLLYDSAHHKFADWLLQPDIWYHKLE